MLTVAEFADKLGITTQRVYQLLKRKRLKIKINKGVTLILDKDLPEPLPTGRPKYRRGK